VRPPPARTPAVSSVQPCYCGNGHSDRLPEWARKRPLQVGHRDRQRVDRCEHVISRLSNASSALSAQLLSSASRTADAPAPVKLGISTLSFIEGAGRCRRPFFFFSRMKRETGEKALGHAAVPKFTVGRRSEQV